MDVQAERRLSSTKQKTAPEATVALPSRSCRTAEEMAPLELVPFRVKVMNLMAHQQSLSFKMVKREV